MATPILPINLNPLAPGTNAGGWQSVPTDPLPDTGLPGWLANKEEVWWEDLKNQQAASGWSNTALPLWQFQQQANQYAQDKNENMRQFNQQYNLNAAQAEYNSALSTRQQETGEDQWNRNYAMQQGQNTFNNDLATNQFLQSKIRDANEANQWKAEFGQTQWRDDTAQANWGKEFGETQQQNLFNQGFQNRSLEQQAALAKQQNDTALTSARYGAFGRSRAPATGWATYG